MANDMNSNSAVRIGGPVSNINIHLMTPPQK